GLGRLDEAADFFQRCLSQRRELGQTNLIAEAIVGQARVARARGAQSEALSHAEELISYLGTKMLEGVEEPILIYLTCFYILQATRDPRAAGILEQAYRALQTQAASIPDEPTRRSFLENVPYHREIIAIWAARSNGNQS